MAGIVFTREQVVQHVLAEHDLVPGGARTDLVGVADDIVGLHGTSPTTPYLSARARLPAFAKADLDRALYEDRSLIRLKGMRGTLFVLSRDVAPIVFAATSRVAIAGDRRWLKLDEAVYDHLGGEVLEILAGTALTTVELRKELGADADLSSVVLLLCDEGKVVRDRPAGSRRSTAFRYRLWSEATPDVDLGRYDEAEATRLLVRAYVGTYGPVTFADIVWWSGIPASRIRQAIGASGVELQAVSVKGLEGEFFMTRTGAETLVNREPVALTVNLLPELDPYAMGYRDRDRYLDPEKKDMVFDRGGNATSVVLVDGRVVGVWDLTEDPAPTARVLLFDSHISARDAVFERAASMGEFWFDKPVAVVEYASMTSLTERSIFRRKPLDDARLARQ